MLGDTFVRDTLAAIADAAEPWLIGHEPGEALPPDVLVKALRAAESSTTGELRDLWGHAAGTADAAAWIDADGDTGRELWATVLDYAQRAVAATPADR